MTALLDMLRPGSPDDAAKIPNVVADRLKRGGERRDKDQHEPTLCLRFARGDQYWYLDQKGIPQFQASGGAGIAVKGQKEPHRVREPHNLISGVVEGKVSAATQRTPGYDVLPSKPDQPAQSAARISQKVLLYGLDQWRLQRARQKVVTNALVMFEGFAFPYYDQSIGPFIPDTDDQGQPIVDEATGEPKLIGRGDVRVKVLSRNQGLWEPGVEFFDSRWHATEEAVAPEEIKAIPGFYGFPLKPDATTAQYATDDDASNKKLVMLTQYFERPSAERPEGRWLRMANKKQVCPEEPFPCVDANGDYVDEPALHYLAYRVDPESDRGGRTFVWDCIPSQRTYNDAWNKLVEWKNRCLNPQMIAPRGSRLWPRKDDTPGATFYYNPGLGNKPEWETPPPIPNELFLMLDKAKSEISDIAAQFDISTLGANAASATVQQAMESDTDRWQQFLASLADFDSRLGRHCLYLVARNYTEPRLIQINGDFGADPVNDFTGAALGSECDVRVTAASLAPQSRDQIEARIFAFSDRGWISPIAAMAAINGGTASGLVNAYEQDVAHAYGIIQKIKQGPDVLFSSYRPRVDPAGGVETDATGQPVLDPKTGQPKPKMIPGWMPRPFDNAGAWQDVFETFMKSPEWDELPHDMQEATLLVYDGILKQKAEQQAQAIAQQQATAAALGMQNAAKPQGATPSPDMPSPTSSPANSPNQPGTPGPPTATAGP